MDTTQTEKYEMLYEVRGLVAHAEERLQILLAREEDQNLRQLEESAITQLQTALRALDFIRPDDPSANK